MAILPRITASRVGIRTLVDPSKTTKKTAPSGKNWSRRLFTNEESDGFTSPRKDKNEHLTGCALFAVPVAFGSPAAEPETHDNCRAGNLQRSGSRTSSVQRREDRGQNYLVHLPRRRIVQRHGQSV